MLLETKFSFHYLYFVIFFFYFKILFCQILLFANDFNPYIGPSLLLAHHFPHINHQPDKTSHPPIPIVSLAPDQTNSVPIIGIRILIYIIYVNCFHTIIGIVIIANIFAGVFFTIISKKKKSFLVFNYF